jgi:hypothetical protein
VNARRRGAGLGLPERIMKTSADRILTTHVGYADLVGRDRVIAGADCGFGTFAGFGNVLPAICWARMKTPAEGARLATTKLWGRTVVV